MTIKYVHDGKEVVMTGRRATKQVRSSIRNKPTTESHVLYEITPAGDGHGSFTKWVALSELYLIEGQEEIHNDPLP